MIVTVMSNLQSEIYMAQRPWHTDSQKTKQIRESHVSVGKNVYRRCNV